ncbi:MAG: adenylyl-sulfate kinase [Clostridia bacterium]|nr:adenylyl-sulfate kinase [Clostridia bacterium]
MTKRVILLNGPSSAGKSTLAKALETLVSKRRNERYAIVLDRRSYADFDGRDDL